MSAEVSAGAVGRSGHDPFEVAAAVLLGLATVAIAWGALQASVWGGIQDARLTDSVLASNDATDLLQNADTTLIFDQTLFLELVLLAEGRVFQTREEFLSFATSGAGAFILDNMTMEAADAAIGWFVDNRLPFDQEYLDNLQAPGEEEFARSDLHLAAAARASENSDRYLLGSTILAVVLLLAGISTVLRSDGPRKLVLGGSIALLVIAVGFLASQDVASVPSLT